MNGVAQSREKRRAGADTVVFLNGMPSASFFTSGVKCWRWQWDVAFVVALARFLRFIFFLLVTGWFSFLLQGRLAQSRWSPDTVIDQQQSGRDRRAVQNTQSFRRRAHARTPALHLHSAKEYPPEQATVFLPHSKILSSNNYRNITRGEERTCFQNSFACLDDNTLMQSRIRWVFIARKVWSRIINIWSRGSYLIQLAHFHF